MKTRQEIVDEFADRIERAFRDFYESPELRKKKKRVDSYQGIWLSPRRSREETNRTESPRNLS